MLPYRFATIGKVFPELLDPNRCLSGRGRYFLEPLVALAHPAAVTKRVRLGVGIYMLALRDAVLVARTIATVDILPGGRLDLAVGIGWSEHEYDFTGNDWKTRGQPSGEQLAALGCAGHHSAHTEHDMVATLAPQGCLPR